jgi:hypothetical protein
MINYLLIYLTGGIIFNLAGPLAVQIRREMADLRLQTVPVEHVLLRRRKLLISELVFRTLVLILYPVAYAMWFADLYRDRKNSATRIVRQEKARREIEAEKEKRKRALLEHRNFVYFNENQGVGRSNVTDAVSGKILLVISMGHAGLSPGDFNARNAVNFTRSR